LQDATEDARPKPWRAFFREVAPPDFYFRQAVFKYLTV